MTNGTAGQKVTVPGGPQNQSFGVVSYPVKLCELVNLNGRQYLTVPQVESPGTTNPNCVGSANEPIALGGWLCVYRGSNGGSFETQDKFAKFIGKFESMTGEYEGTGQAGELVPFRTKEFSEGGGSKKEVLEHIKLTSYLSAGGSWAVSAP